MIHPIKPLLVAMLIAAPPLAWAQSTDDPAPDSEQANPADLMTQAELEVLVAPVALFPDTLLIQVLVASTYPLEIVKSDRFLAGSTETDPDLLQASIEEQDWDDSVEVLATAFPDVIADMATHVEWTETMGNAMLAQSDDVMIAVQTMRQQAINAGALISGEQQTVDVDEDENVVIQPTNPEVVYVPQYDPQVVYQDNGVGGAIATGLIAWGTFAIIDEIFDNDDDWNDYWGCRNCGGWGGGPIIHSPDIDIDVDGNVNIGNEIDLGDRPDRNPDGGWKPDDKKRDDARDKISSKRDGDGKTKLPIDKPASRGDDMRANLSAKSGAADISRPGNDRLPQVDRPSARPSDAKKAAAAKTRPNPQAKAPAAKKQQVKKPSAKRAAPKKKAAPRKSSAVHKKASAPKARAGSSRGKAGGAKHKGRR